MDRSYDPQEIADAEAKISRREWDRDYGTPDDDQLADRAADRYEQHIRGDR
jgi:hypothetical protein